MRSISGENNTSAAGLIRGDVGLQQQVHRQVSACRIAGDHNVVPASPGLS